MPHPVPVDDSARVRLREAQKAEAAALAAVQAAERCRVRAAQALHRAESAVTQSRLELVKVSGVDRAALLLNVPATHLRRLTRGSDGADSSG